jgi:hypothetical protein
MPKLKLQAASCQLPAASLHCPMYHLAFSRILLLKITSMLYAAAILLSVLVEITNNKSPQPPIHQHQPKCQLILDCAICRREREREGGEGG